MFLVCFVYIAIKKDFTRKSTAKSNSGKKTYKIVTIISSIALKILTKTTCHNKKQTEKTSANGIS